MDYTINDAMVEYKLLENELKARKASTRNLDLQKVAE